MNHYYVEYPKTKHDLKKWDCILRKKKFHFLTDKCTFSRKKVDYGSLLLIESFNEKKIPKGAVLDIGCGYGVIGLALALTGRFIEMVDINKRAVELAQKNAVLNNIKNVDIHQSNIYETLNQKKYSCIITNPPIRAGKKVVYQILNDSSELLVKDGILMIVVQKKQGALGVKKKMLEIFNNVKTIKKSKGYHVMKSVKNRVFNNI